MKAIQQNWQIINSLSCILNILWVIDVSLILFNTSRGIYWIPKESEYTSVLLSVNNGTQCDPLLFLLSRFLTCAPSFILGKLFLQKTLLNLGSYLK